MKKHIITLILLMLIVSIASLFATIPDWRWAIQTGPYQSHEIKISQDNAGNIFYVDPYSCTVTKYDVSGNFVWTQSPQGGYSLWGRGIAVDANGDCFVTGFFMETATFGETVFYAYDYNLFAAKLSSSGDWLWVDTYVPPGPYWYGYAGGTDIAVDASGACYVTLWGNADWGEICANIIKWSSNGELLWSWGNDTSARGGSVALDSQGNSYITQDGNLVRKISASGQLLWDLPVHWRIWGYDNKVDTDGNIYVTGGFGGQQSFGASTLTGPEENFDSDMFITKLDSSGNFLWAKRAGGQEYNRSNYGTAIALDVMGNILVTGRYSGTDVAFGSTLLSSVGVFDCFLACLDTDGNWLWATSVGGTGYNLGTSLSRGPFGGILLAGFHSNGFTAGGVTFNSDGSFLARLGYDFPSNFPILVPIGTEQVTVIVTSGTGLDTTPAGILPEVGIPNSGFDAFWLSGTGTQSFSVQTTRDWGAAYFNGSWHQYLNSGGTVHFSNVAFDAKGDVPFILGNNDDTLPVVLSSFSATLTAQGYVALSWTTQSESGLNGYYIYRSADGLLAHAQIVSPLIGATNSSTTQNYHFTDYELSNAGTYHYWLESREYDGNSGYHGPVSVLFVPGGDNTNPEIPLLTALHTPYPNPFNPNLYISYGLAKASDVRIAIYNSRGQLVRSFANSQVPAGNHRLIWDGKDSQGVDCASGVYNIRFQAGKTIHSSKAVLLK